MMYSPEPGSSNSHPILVVLSKECSVRIDFTKMPSRHDEFDMLRNQIKLLENVLLGEVKTEQVSPVVPLAEMPQRPKKKRTYKGRTFKDKGPCPIHQVARNPNTNRCNQCDKERLRGRISKDGRTKEKPADSEQEQHTVPQNWQEDKE